MIALPHLAGCKSLSSRDPTVATCLILYFINFEMHISSYFDISEIKMHQTLDDSLQLKLAAFFLVIHGRMVLLRVGGILDGIKYPSNESKHFPTLTMS